MCECVYVCVCVCRVWREGQSASGKGACSYKARRRRGRHAVVTRETDPTSSSSSALTPAHYDAGGGKTVRPELRSGASQRGQGEAEGDLVERSGALVVIQRTKGRGDNAAAHTTTEAIYDPERRNTHHHTHTHTQAEGCTSGFARSSPPSPPALLLAGGVRGCDEGAEGRGPRVRVEEKGREGHTHTAAAGAH